jgi:hypothetical protein
MLGRLAMASPPSPQYSMNRLATKVCVPYKNEQQKCQGSTIMEREDLIEEMVREVRLFLLAYLLTATIYKSMVV